MSASGVPLSALGMASAPEQELLCIFGTGDLGRSLGQRLLQTGYRVVLVPGALVVKGLNTLSAWVLLNGPLAGKQVYLCGDSADAKQAVRELATRLGLSVLDKGCLSAAREVEDFPLQLFPQWRLPLCLAAGLSAFFFFYLLIRDVIYAYVEQDKDISYRILVSLANKVFPIVSLIMLSLCYLPGVLAAFLQLYRGTKYSVVHHKKIPPRSKLGHLTLLVCTAHGYLYAWNKFLRPSTYKWWTPPGSMLCLVVPSVVLVLKLLILLPCVDRSLGRIRQGWERTEPEEGRDNIKATSL
ncbi:hypothetical protein CRUP_034620 [Coryphaenoides rupestris]|nr:hypothetical protein CRUP_034620 [Coryphaenoides rupestris]